MATQTVQIKFNGRSGKLDIHTNGFIGEACSEITNAVKADLHALIISENRTEEAFLDVPALEHCQSQETCH